MSVNPNPSGWVSEDGLCIIDLANVCVAVRGSDATMYIRFYGNSEPYKVSQTTDADWASFKTAFLIHRSHR